MFRVLTYLRLFIVDCKQTRASAVLKLLGRLENKWCLLMKHRLSSPVKWPCFWSSRGHLFSASNKGHEKSFAEADLEHGTPRFNISSVPFDVSVGVAVVSVGPTADLATGELRSVQGENLLCATDCSLRLLLLECRQDYFCRRWLHGIGELLLQAYLSQIIPFPFYELARCSQIRFIAPG